MELTEVSYTHFQDTHRASNTFACDPEPLTKTYLSTVLAQDHFFSDFLSLHLTPQSDHDDVVGRGLQEFKLRLNCRFDESCEPTPV